MRSPSQPPSRVVASQTPAASVQAISTCWAGIFSAAAVADEEAHQQIAGGAVAHEDQRGQQYLARMPAQQLAQRRGAGALARLHLQEYRRFLDRAADEGANHDQQHRQQEGHAPAPVHEAFHADGGGEAPEHAGGDDHAHGHADLRKGAEQRAAVRRRVFHRHQAAPPHSPPAESPAARAVRPAAPAPRRPARHRTAAGRSARWPSPSG